jgi:hypothetical protein
VRERSLQVMKTTYTSGLQEHRIIEYTATGQKSKARGTYEHGNHRYRKLKQNTRSAACRREAEEHMKFIYGLLYMVSRYL